MKNSNKDVPPGSEDLIPTQQRKRKRRSNNNESENSQPCTSNMNNTGTSIPLSKAFPRVLSDISNIHHKIPSSTISIGANDATDNGIDENGQGKRLKRNSHKLMSQSSNQTTVSNIVGGSSNVSTTLKRKRSATKDVTDHTPSTFSRKKHNAKSGVLTDISNVLPTPTTFPGQFGTSSTSRSCITKISTKAKGKGKVLAGDDKFESITITNSVRKTLEAQFDGCVDDNPSSEDDEDQPYQCDYEEESELYNEQVYDCSSEESDTSDSETIGCDPMLSTDASCKRMTKATSSRKQYGTQFVSLT
ncbi:hypothetical protein Rs2_44260 [Raphanus sativus]|nr:hypothetical protein Rs2_44260 [Raphanus sativus]